MQCHWNKNAVITLAKIAQHERDGEIARNKRQRMLPDMRSGKERTGQPVRPAQAKQTCLEDNLPQQPGLNAAAENHLFHDGDGDDENDCTG